MATLLSRWRRGLGALAAIGLVGCPPALPHVETTPPGQTDFVLEPHLEAPFSLRRARIAVDGQIAFERAFEGDAPPRLLAARAPLVAGEHYLQVELDVIVQCGVEGALRAGYTVHAARAFEVSPNDGGSLTLDLHTRGVSRDFKEQLDLTFRVSGSVREHRVDHVPGRYRSPERCPSLTPPKRALCRAEADVAEARRDRDVVRLICTTTKLSEMRQLDAQPMTEETSSKLVALGMEADDCAGQLDAQLENYVESRATCPEGGP